MASAHYWFRCMLNVIHSEFVYRMHVLMFNSWNFSDCWNVLLSFFCSDLIPASVAFAYQLFLSYFLIFWLFLILCKMSSHSCDKHCVNEFWVFRFVKCANFHSKSVECLKILNTFLILSYKIELWLLHWFIEFPVNHAWIQEDIPQD